MSVSTSESAGIDLVTGGTGFIGAHVVRALLAKGARVRCLVRPAGVRRNLDGLAVDLVEGDLRDGASLFRAMSGIRTVYHCAADYRLWARDPRELYASNVEGTRNVLAAAAKAGVRRIVYTSSVAAIGIAHDGAADEETPMHPGDLIGAYKKSKYEAELVARQAADDGLPVVIVNPSTPLGELDVKPTPTGQIIVDFLNGKMPAYVETGLNLVDVRDVAAGHLLAAEKGRIGERYILGNRNATLKELFDVLARISGLRSPRVKLPHWIPMAFAAVDTTWSKVTGRAPRVPFDSARMARHRMYFESAKAVRELGLPQTPIEQALERAVQWFRDNGYVHGLAVAS
ncbi:MAG TPA: hopanoid-associated sugar epimerase [Thermoanaerobaculia bacterium]|nr:hopanoid-associated sugar epimerase [Thermoanaerobaculia bacterium]